MQAPRHDRLLTTYIAVLAIVALASFSLLAFVDRSYGDYDVNWFVFGLFAVLLFLSETRPSLWMRFGEGGEVTPGWSFAYTLVLLGCPTGAVVAMVATHLYVDLRHQKGTLKTVFNGAQIAIALSAGSIVLHAFGLHRGLAGSDGISLVPGIGIVVGGVAIFTISGLLTAVVIAIHQGISVRQVVHSDFALSMTADGALLALAPVFVIAIEYSIIMVPLLGVTSYLVYYSARNALRQQHEASHDPLTMLLNRRAFDHRVGLGLDGAPPESVAVLVMDLDRFKDINDRLGHQVGDRLLISFGRRLERALPAPAITSRLGGDEFGVLIGGITSPDELRERIADLHATLVRPHDLDGFPLTVAVSIGVATNVEGATTTDAMMAAADVAMYRAKQYETGVEYSGPRNPTGDHGRIGLLHDLSRAIEQGEIRPYYQPQIDLADGTIASVEALMRWNHPVHGWIPPNDFIGLAEQTDLIGPMTELMFRTAMQECRMLAPHFPRLAVNVAPRSLLDRQFASRILAIVEAVGFPADHLEIEITERAIVSGSERTAISLEQFRAAGVTVSIDDFGTGYSSFQTLRTVEANRLKIDRQFSSQLDTSPADELIVTKIIELAHGLGLDVVAEGVESDAVWRRLRALGCDVAQGFAIARPMPFDQLRTWLTDEAPVVVPTAATPPAPSTAATPPAPSPSPAAVPSVPVRAPRRSALGRPLHAEVLVS